MFLIPPPTHNDVPTYDVLIDVEMSPGADFESNALVDVEMPPKVNAQCIQLTNRKGIAIAPTLNAFHMNLYRQHNVFIGFHMKAQRLI